MVRDASATDLKKSMTEEEFDAIETKHLHGVNFEDREKFLKDNGYEVNRANMMDRDLSHR